MKKEGIQDVLFDLPSQESIQSRSALNAQRIEENYVYKAQSKQDLFQIQNRRYIGGKQKLIEWIFSIIQKECEGDSFLDIFAGTGIVSAVASKHFQEIILNDFLHSNYVIYQAFFSSERFDQNKFDFYIHKYNSLNAADLDENYFSESFGGKYFSNPTAKIIGHIRENLEKIKDSLTNREYYSLLTSLIYAMDKVANTVGHYDAYFKRNPVERPFLMKHLDPVRALDVSIFKEDANKLARTISSDIVYIDPPYNSRQYSRFYHVLETLTKWDKPILYGTALKPSPENMSDYCRITAKDRFSDLVDTLKANYFVVSYNNTYNSKSSSSENKITLEEINSILCKRGKTKVFEKEYRHFNTGNTDFNNHKEYLFVTKVNHG